MSDDDIIEEYDSLFGGEKLPSLFDKTHGDGTSRTGIITKVPEDRQSRFYKAGGKGALKYWGPAGKPTDQPVDKNGKENKPCMDTVFVLSTEYRLNEHELADKEMDEDSGNRGVFASGAMKTAVVRVFRGTVDTSVRFAASKMSIAPLLPEESGDRN